MCTGEVQCYGVLCKGLEHTWCPETDPLWKSEETRKQATITKGVPPLPLCSTCLYSHHWSPSDLDLTWSSPHDRFITTKGQSLLLSFKISFARMGFWDWKADTVRDLGHRIMPCYLVLNSESMFLKEQLRTSLLVLVILKLSRGVCYFSADILIENEKLS